MMMTMIKVRGWAKRGDPTSAEGQHRRRGEPAELQGDSPNPGDNIREACTLAGGTPRDQMTHNRTLEALYLGLGLTMFILVLPLPISSSTVGSLAQTPARLL